MKKVCFFSGDISRSGGTERVATLIASELAKRGYEVSILSVVRGEKSFFPLHADVQLYSLHMEGKSANFSNTEIIFKLRRYIKVHTLDFVIDVDIILSAYSIVARIGTSAKVVSWEHFHFHINVGDLFQRARRSFAKRLASRFSKYIVTLTDKDRFQYLANMRCKTDVITINNPKTIFNTRIQMVDTKIVLAAGRLTHQKGFDLLLECWLFVSILNPDWKLRIVGSGEDEGKLIAISKKLNIDRSVEFIPETDDIGKYYRDASIYVLSSRYEGFGLVLLEAKSFGLPIVSFDCDCGPSDIVRNGVDGLLVQNGNVRALAGGLVSLINDLDKRIEFGGNGFNDDRFDVNRIVGEWEKVLS